MLSLSAYPTRDTIAQQGVRISTTGGRLDLKKFSSALECIKDLMIALLLRWEVKRRMATAEQIKQRVEQADRRRIDTRADAAAAVAGIAQEHTAIAEGLRTTETVLGEAIGAALGVMSAAELAAFTDLSAADIHAWSTPSKSRSGRRRPQKRATANTAPQATAAERSTSEAESDPQ